MRKIDILRPYCRCGLVAMSLITPLAGSAQTIDEQRAAFREAAEAKRAEYATMSFEEFEAVTIKEPGDDGKYIVNGDIPIANRKQLREFFENNVAIEPSPIDATSPEFAVAIVGGLQAVWSTAQKRALTYCVSTSFASHYSNVIAQIDNAANAWESVADVDFIHVSSEDDDCTPSNDRVVFDVRPAQWFGIYQARAFRPDAPRANRNLLIDEASLTIDSGSKRQLDGILRHELGHTLGARHEQTRPEAGRCFEFEDEHWDAITDYDPFSVMHYPHCIGLGNQGWTLTHSDKNGAACLYGAASGFTIDPEVCSDPLVAINKTLSFDDEKVGLNEERRYDTLPVRAGTLFVAEITAVGDTPGDPDLYVKFDGTPQVGIEFDCRPFLDGADERCELDVPADASIARILVHGHEAGHYELKINYVAP